MPRRPSIKVDLMAHFVEPGPAMRSTAAQPAGGDVLKDDDVRPDIAHLQYLFTALWAGLIMDQHAEHRHGFHHALRLNINQEQHIAGGLKDPPAAVPALAFERTKRSDPVSRLDDPADSRAIFAVTDRAAVERQERFKSVAQTLVRSSAPGNLQAFFRHLQELGIVKRFSLDQHPFLVQENV